VMFTINPDHLVLPVIGIKGIKVIKEISFPNFDGRRRFSEAAIGTGGQ